MIPSIYSAASGMEAQARKLDVAANNIANISSTGYKSKRVDIVDSGNGATTRGVTTNPAQGPLVQTGVPSDLAVNGNGYFQVEDSAGNVSYTRSGAFVQDAEGYLRTQSGEYLSGANGRVQIPTGSQTYSIGSDGSVNVVDTNGNSTVVNSITLSTFPNSSGLTATGNGLYSPSSASGAATTSTAGQNGTGTISSGSLEMSNVDYVNESVTSIISQRMFEANAKTIQVADEMLKTLIDTNHTNS